MAHHRLSSLLLLLLYALGVIAALGEDMKFEVIKPADAKQGYSGGYWFQSVVPSSNPITDADLQDAAQRGFQTTKARARKTKHPIKGTKGIDKPPIVSALWIPGKGTVVASSIKVFDVAQSSQTCETINWKHRNGGNCAEPNAVTIARQQGWQIVPGSKMAVYGQISGSGTGFQSPCGNGHENGDGCQRFLGETKNIKLVNPKASGTRSSDVSKSATQKASRRVAGDRGMSVEWVA